VARTLARGQHAQLGPGRGGVRGVDRDKPAPLGVSIDLHIVGASATGAWAGQDDNLARYVAEGDFWQFFTAGDQVRIAFNDDDGGLYVWHDGEWKLLAQVSP
jgi:hypothetical protein